MSLVNRRDSLLLLASGLSGCAPMTANTQAQSRMVVDDGTSKITPVYVMTYLEGQPATFVRADYYYIDAKKQVQLRPEGSIKVNGIPLQRDPKELISYIAYTPLAPDLLTFEFTRSTGQVIKHSFALPELDIVELPKRYRAGEPLPMAINHRPPRAGVMRDSYSLSIYASSGRYPLDSKAASANQVVFEAIHGQIRLPTESAQAHIFRQQRTPLKDISDALQTGWAVASRSRDFTIEISN